MPSVILMGTALNMLQPQKNIPTNVRKLTAPLFTIGQNFPVWQLGLLMKFTPFRLIALTCAIGLASLQGAYAADRPYLIGFLSAATAERDKPVMTEFRHALKDRGFHQGNNIRIEERYAAGDYRKLPRLAKDLVSKNVDVLVAVGPAAGYAKASTTTIPIVIRTADPVGKGLVRSLQAPGGNVTGLSSFNANLILKRLELFKKAVPSASRIAALWYPRQGSSHIDQMRKLQDAAPEMAIELIPVAIRGPKDWGRVFEEVRKHKPDALIAFAGGIFEANRDRIIKFVSDNKLPSSFGYAHWPLEGAFMSYGPNGRALNQRLAEFVAKILKGAKPENLPVEQPTKFDFTINLAAARLMGISVPREILLRATTIIE